MDLMLIHLQYIMYHFFFFELKDQFHKIYLFMLPIWIYHPLSLKMLSWLIDHSGWNEEPLLRIILHTNIEFHSAFPSSNTEKNWKRKILLNGMICFLKVLMYIDIFIFMVKKQG